jgi:hypothetical protein
MRDRTSVLFPFCFHPVHPVNPVVFLSLSAIERKAALMLRSVFLSYRLIGDW